MLTQTHSCCEDPFKEFITACAIGQEVRLEPWLRPTDPLPLGTSTHIEFRDVGSTFSVSFNGMVQCTPVFTGQVLPARTDYTSVTCAACSMTNEMATPSESFSACDWCGALCWFLRFGHRCLRQARVSDDTCKERRPRHEHVCGSIEVPFCIVLVRWSGQVKCGSASPFGVVSAAQGLSAQVLFRFGEVGPPCSCHVLFGRRGLGRSQKDP